jgi:hypothetical protein
MPGKKAASGAKGKRAKKVALPPSQRTLFQYIAAPDDAHGDPRRRASSLQMPSSPLATNDDKTEPEDDHFEIAKQKIIGLIQSHQLNEAVAMFRMRDRLRFSVRKIRQLYFAMQTEVVAEFGSRLAASLFPAEILGDSSRPSEDSSMEPQSSQCPNFRC